MKLGQTPSQTVGPFFELALDGSGLASFPDRPTAGERVTIEGRVLDGDQALVPDALIEVWQPVSGFARAATDDVGRFIVRIVKPVPAPSSDKLVHAPHLAVSVFARGLLKRLTTRIYFSDEVSNSSDQVLNTVPSARRKTLIADTKPGSREPVYVFDVVLQGEDETVFFDA